MFVNSTVSLYLPVDLCLTHVNNDAIEVLSLIVIEPWIGGIMDNFVPWDSICCCFPP